VKKKMLAMLLGFSMMLTLVSVPVIAQTVVVANVDTSFRVPLHEGLTPDLIIYMDVYSFSRVAEKQWYHSSGVAMAAGEHFVAGKKYYCQIRVEPTARSGSDTYEYNADTKLLINAVAAQHIVSRSSNHIIGISQEMTATVAPTVLDGINITVTAPVAGAKPSGSATVDTPNATVASVSWSATTEEDNFARYTPLTKDDVFVAGGVYTAFVTVRPKAGYDLPNQVSETVLINGVASTNSTSLVDGRRTYGQRFVATAPAGGGKIVMTLNSLAVTQGGKRLEDPPVPPQLVNNRTMLPFRYLIQTLLGGEVGWDGATQTVTARVNGVTFLMVIGEKTMVVNGKPVFFDQPPVVIAGRTLVPVRVFEAAVKRIVWSGANQSVTIEK